MPDAALPFRPRTLTPVERALGSIAAQMSHGRRRMNRLSIEHALFVAIGAALTAFSVLVALAFRLSPAGFAVATWALLAGVVTIALGCIRRFRAAWVPSARAALVIDDRAGLQERLATLCAAGAAGRRSRLWTFLLHENLRLLPTWEPRRLVPRLIPRSIWFFAFALLLAALAAGRIPPSPSSARSPGDADRSASDQTLPPAADEGSESNAEEGAVSSSTLWTGLPQALQRAILGSGSPQQFAGRIPERTLPVDDDRGGPAIVGRRMKNAGPSRSAPASPEAMSLAGAGKADRGTMPAPNANRPSESTTSPNPRPAQGDRPTALAADAGRSQPQGSAPKAEQAKGGAGGGGGGPGAGGGGDREGLLGERQAAAKASGSFTLDLDALRGTRPDRDGEDTEPASRPPAVLSSDPRLDDAVRRAQIPTEYEKIVQRIFNRTVDAGERP